MITKLYQSFIHVLIFISSYIPIFIMIFLNNLDSFKIMDIIKTWNKNPYLWVTMIIISIFSFIFLSIWIHSLKKVLEMGKRTFKIMNLKSFDSEILNYFVTFIVPVLSLKPESSPSIVMNVIFLLLEAIYFIRNNALHYNVLLVVLGYHVYTFNDDCVLITKKEKSEIMLNIDRYHAVQVGTTNIYYL